MKTINISDEVWNAIKARGKFGETEADSVLRRIFNIPSSSQSERPAATNGSDHSNDSHKRYGWKERRAKDRMTQNVVGNKLVLEFDSGQKFERPLPSKDDHRAIRELRDAAVEFVRSNQGTKGQEHAAIKALTHRGYYITVKREYV